MTESRWRAPFAGYITAAAIALFILLSASTAHRPFHLDNVDFPAAAEATANTGLPIYYRGEEQPHTSGLYHPPLYIYTLAAWMRAFGPGEAQVRLFGMVCALLQGVVVLWILRTLFGPAATRRWAPFFWVIYLLNPFTLQAATIADIDTTIYGPLLCAAILAVLRISWRDGEWRTGAVRRWDYALVVAMLLVCLWAKLTTVLLTFPFVFFLLISRLGARKAVLAAVAIVAASVAAFGATYALYGAVTGMDVRQTLEFTWMSFTQRGTSGSPGLMARLGDYYRNSTVMIPFMVAWTGLVPWVAGLVALGMAAAAAFRKQDRRMTHYALVLGLALLTTGYYCAKVGTFGAAPFKYVLVYWGLVLTAPLLVLAGEDSPLARRPRMAAVIGAAAFAAATVWSARFFQDRLMLQGFSGLYTLAAFLPAMLFLLGVALMWRIPAACGVAVLGFALFCGIQFGSGIYQERVAYATTYDYGQTGLLETAAFIESNTTPGDIVVSMKDVGYLSHRRYYENYGALYGDSASQQTLERVIERGLTAYMVFTEGRGQDQLAVSPPFRQWLLERCTMVRSFGNYRVYQLTETLRKKHAAECAQGAK